MASNKKPCQARILHNLKPTPVNHWTTKECEEETTKRISVDSGDAYMNICSCCFKRFIKRMVEKNTWHGWFDCEYPPESRVVGSKWHYDNVIKSLPTPVVLPNMNMLEQEAEEAEKQEAEEAEEQPLTGEEKEEAEEEQEQEQEQEQEAEEEQEQETDAEVESLRQGIAAISIEPEKTKEEKKDELRQRIKEIQKVAKPGKMTMKEIQAAFKEITNLKAKIHML